MTMREHEDDEEKFLLPSLYCTYRPSFPVTLRYASLYADENNPFTTPRVRDQKDNGSIEGRNAPNPPFDFHPSSILP